MRTFIETPILTLLLLITSAAPAMALSGGPDAYGTIWADSSSGGPAFDYVYAPTSGSFSSDDGSFEVTMPFNTNITGIPTNTLEIHANGAITLAGMPAGATNDCDPWSGVIAPFWDDLASSTTGSVYYGSTGSSPSRVYIVEWWGVGHELSDGEITFEVKFFESDGHVEFHYSDVTLTSSTYSLGASASVGLFGGLEVSCNSAMLGNSYAIGFYPGEAVECDDFDGDGWCVEDGDCDDVDPTSFPGASEVCDGEDNDCDGQWDEGFDVDGDEWTSCDGDCDDFDEDVSPSQPEICDGRDQDCDGQIDDGFDQDVDGWTTCNGDCNDDEWDIHPEAIDEPGDGIDSDCDGIDPVPDGDDDDDATDDDDDDDATDDDDDATDDDDDNDNEGRSRSRGSRSAGCAQADSPAEFPLNGSLALVLFGLAMGRCRTRR